MEKRKTLILNILICLSFCLTTYIFINEEMMVNKSILPSSAAIKTFENPLPKIFIGDGSVQHSYQTRFREKKFMACAMYALLIIGIIRYYRSDKQKIRGLLYVLLAQFFGYTAMLFSTFFNICLSVLNSSNFSFQNLTSNTNFWINTAGLRFLGLVMLFYPIKILVDAIKPLHKADNQILPLKPMRVFHSLNDKMILIILLNVLLWRHFLISSGDRLTGIILFQLTLVASYFIVEWLYKVSPGKVLTGTYIVSSDDTKRAISVSQILLRSFTRLIPFESFSFLGQKGWHDQFSTTTIAYNDAENWLSRQSRIIKTASFCFNMLALWLFIASIFRLVNRSSTFEQIADLPLTLTSIGLLLMFFLFVSWLSSVSAFAQMKAYDESTEMGYNINNILSWWIPLMHFTAPSKTLFYIVEDFEKIAEKKNIEESKLEKVRVTSKTLSSGFAFFYTSVILSCLGFYFVNWEHETYIASLVLSLGVMCFCFFVTNYANAIKDLSTQIEK